MMTTRITGLEAEYGKITKEKITVWLIRFT